MRTRARGDLLLLFGAFLALALSCGRSELDWGNVDNVPVGPGAAGSSPDDVGQGGTTGAAGRQGSAGTTAAAGRQGSAGTTAAAGRQGSAGTTGAAGRQGSGGTTGAAGRQGSAGTTGAAGRGGLPPVVPCGASACTPGMQTCCIRPQVGAMCIAVGQTCDAGATIGCLTTPSCGGGRNVCCISPQTLSTSCTDAVACLTSPGLILCGADADCPQGLRNCCGQGLFRFCRPRACNGNGMGGGRGNGQ